MNNPPPQGDVGGKRAKRDVMDETPAPGYGEEPPITSILKEQTSKQNSSDINDISALVADELEQVNALIKRELNSNVPFVNMVSKHIVDSGGKKIRPLVALLIAKAHGNYSFAHLKLAAIVEFIHTATLLHDDVVDNAGMRRGKPTALRLWGSASSVLVGDFLYSRAFELIAGLRDSEITGILAKTTNIIAEGEVEQLTYVGDTSVSEAAYMRVIAHKSAELFAATARISAVLSKVGEPVQNDLAKYGFELGLAFQLIDDALDYQGGKKMGKTPGADLAEGKVTLPLIHALKHCSKEKRKRIKEIVSCGDRSGLQEILNVFQAFGSITFVRQKAEKIAARAQSRLRNIAVSPYRKALEELPLFVCSRDR